MAFQLLPGSGSESPIGFLLFYAPFIIFLLYGQKFQTWMILNDVARSLNKLKMLKERGRREAVDYVKKHCGSGGDPTDRVDQLLEYFTILPVDLDPHGIVPKIEHTMTTRDTRIRSEIRKIAYTANPVQASAGENIVEAATALNMIYKIVRHFYLLGKKTTSLYVLIQLQMIMPLVLQEAEAMGNAIEAFKHVQPIGDAIGPLVVGRLMVEREKKPIAKDTVYAESEMDGRRLVLLKAEGPGGNVGEPGTAVDKLVNGGMNFSCIVMIDAALKLEGERTGDLAEGVGAAIGGIGVDRFKIEEVATKKGIPLYAIVIKQSIVDAISVMKKEIAEAGEKVHAAISNIIQEKTKIGDLVLVVGVGNTLGVGQ